MGLIFYAVNQYFMDFMLGTGRHKHVHVFTIFERFIYAVVCAYVLGLVFGIKGVFASFSIAQMCFTVHILIHVWVKNKKYPKEMEQFMLSMNVNRFGMVLFLCVATCLLGMVVTGSSLIVVFGSVFITALVSVGVDPILAAAMLPCICGIMSNITPPLAPGLYAGMSLAEADFGKTVKNDLWWVASQFILQVVVLMGWLPILGL